MLTKLVDGIEVICSDEEEAEIRAKWAAADAETAALGYRLLRQEAYPDFATQLDMMYHDRMSGTSTWVDTIQGIKNRYPKPQA